MIHTILESTFTIEECISRLTSLPSISDVRKRQTSSSIIPIGCDADAVTNRYRLYSHRDPWSPRNYKIELCSINDSTEVKIPTPPMKLLAVAMTIIWFVVSALISYKSTDITECVLGILLFTTIMLLVANIGYHEIKDQFEITVDFLRTLLETSELSIESVSVEPTDKYSIWTEMKPEHCWDKLQYSIDFRPVAWIPFFTFSTIFGMQEKNLFNGDIFSNSFCIEKRGTGADFGIYPIGMIRFYGKMIAENGGTRIVGHFDTRSLLEACVLYYWSLFACGGFIISIEYHNLITFSIYFLIFFAVFYTSVMWSRHSILKTLIELLDAGQAKINDGYKPRNCIIRILN